MKTKLIFAGAAALLGMTVTAQNASYDFNAVPIGGSNSSAFGFQSLIGNSGRNNSALGHTALNSNKDGNDNTAAGHTALFKNANGSYNTAVGVAALHENNADFNSAFGDSALYSNTSGSLNSAFGTMALLKNNSGANSAFGYGSLRDNQTGAYNTAMGATALHLNVTGIRNTALGMQSMHRNASGDYNTAVGMNSFFHNVNGSKNTAIGHESLYSNSSGYGNTSAGEWSMVLNTSGDYNTSIGMRSMALNTSGYYNSAIGYEALYNNTQGSSNTAVGHIADVADTALSNATALGHGAIVNASDKTWIGDTYMSVTECVGGVYAVSDGRFKTNVKSDDVKGLEFIKRLRPVVYNFDTRKFTEFMTKNMKPERREQYLKKDAKASTAIRQSGFIAQEVEQAAKDAGYNFNGVHKPVNDNDNYSLSYGQFVVPLVKAVQEQQALMEAQDKTIADLNRTVADLKKQVESLAAAASQKEQNMAAGVQYTSAVISQQPSGLGGFSMEQNIPNPFTHETLIKYNLPQQVSQAYMAVYDLSGKQVTTFSILQKGSASLSITADKLAPGMYIYSIVADGAVLDSKRMIVAGK